MNILIVNSFDAYLLKPAPTLIYFLLIFVSKLTHLMKTSITSVFNFFLRVTQELLKNKLQLIGRKALRFFIAPKLTSGMKNFSNLGSRPEIGLKTSTV